jgi:hypothetical protein
MNAILNSSVLCVLFVVPVIRVDTTCFAQLTGAMFPRANVKVSRKLNAECQAGYTVKRRRCG